jgi:ribosomal protein S18 acetylase RimI-like enzyme
MASAVILRRAVAGDRDFLRSLYATTRADELAVVPWTDAEKAAFLDMQFAAQDAGYGGSYPGGRSLIVELDGRPVGRLFTARLSGEIRIVDIALLPEHRGRGIGTQLVREVMAEAAADGSAVTLHVEQWNPARRLYGRLGFRVVEQRGIHDLMQWVAPVPDEGPAGGKGGSAEPIATQLNTAS